tara:strand:- start:2817 stop:3347 length:531 start_codon:yes stop_codon:yes gene_type:complete
MKNTNFSIISGKYKGLKISGKLSKSVRPTSSLVRKSIFDTLRNIENLHVLDLFAGSGILGFEALSRGASSITFVEKDLNQIKFIKNNSLKFKNEKINIFKNDVFNFLKRNDLMYNLIFADPPYYKINLNDFYKIIQNYIVDGGTLILECSIKENFLNNAVKEKIFGNTKIIFLKNE